MVLVLVVVREREREREISSLSPMCLWDVAMIVIIREFCCPLTGAKRESVSLFLMNIVLPLHLSRSLFFITSLVAVRYINGRITFFLYKLFCCCVLLFRLFPLL